MSPCTHGRPPSPALCPFAPLPRAPCCLLRGVPPFRVPFCGALLVPLLSLTHGAHYACPYRLLLVPHPCPAPRCLPVHAGGTNSLAPPPIGRCAPPPLRCSVLPALPLSTARHWVARCAPLPTPPVHPGALTLAFLTASPAGGWCLVLAPGAAGDGAGAQCAPAPRTTLPAGGAPPSPPPAAPPH